jgi:hypothetical protein
MDHCSSSSGAVIVSQAALGLDAMGRSHATRVWCLMQAADGLILLCVLFSAWGFYLFARVGLFLTFGKKCPGSVVARDVTGDSDVCTIEFTDLEGRTRHFSPSHAYPIGERVSVVYFPSNPGKAEVRDFMSLWLPAVMVTAGGLGYLVVWMLRQ